MSQRTLVVGDIHGCAQELEALVASANPTHIIVTGDLFTRGPDPLGVWQLLAFWDRTKELNGVLGNHDQRLLDVVNGNIADQQPITDTIIALSKEGNAWAEWLQHRPVFLKVGAFTVVHAGLHPYEGQPGTSKEMAQNLRHWPFGRTEGPLWHAKYTAQERVIFGHDARRGLVRIERDGLPWIVGLDSGCVYGGRLSGYLIEEDRLYSVRAKDMYVDPTRVQKRTN